jgi:membrane-bound serine protease (ClpP class)
MFPGASSSPPQRPAPGGSLTSQGVRSCLASLVAATPLDPRRLRAAALTGLGAPKRARRIGKVRFLRFALLSLVLGLGLQPQADAQPGSPVVEVVKVQGVVDGSVAAYVSDALHAAERSGATLILQMDSSFGSYRDEAVRLGTELRSAPVPVIAWVGPSGARAAGGALVVVYSSSLVAMAPGAGIGPARPFDLGTSAQREDPDRVAGLSRELEKLATSHGVRPAGIRRLISGPAFPTGPALDSGVVAFAATDLRDLLTKLDGRTVRTPTGSAVLATRSTTGRPVAVRFHEIGPVRRLLHAVSTPAAVYVLLVLGLWGIAFELTQPGFGVAGIAGIVSLALAGFGLFVIPVNWAGVALIVAGTGLQGLDVVIKRVAVLTAVGTLAFLAGSLLAWWGVAPAVDLSLWVIALFTVGGALFFGFGMTVALRARQRVRQAQVGLVGLIGEVRTDLDPEGGVYVKGSLWRARSMDGPIPKGARVRIKGVDGLILRVQQEPD